MAALPPVRLAVPVEYGPLHRYLLDRYATNVVLRFSEIEAILGFALPASACVEPTWWDASESSKTLPAHSRAWIEANRTATPNLPARTVAFERALA